MLFGAALRAASFSGLVFGAIPESYPIAGPAVTALLAWLAWWLPARGQISRAGRLAWGALAAFATGVTVSLIGFAGIVLAIGHHRRQGLLKGFGQAIALSTAVLLAVLLFGAVGARLQGAPAIEHQHIGVPPYPDRSWLETFVSVEPAVVAAKSFHFATDFFQAIAAIGFRRVPSIWGIPHFPDDLLLPAPAHWSRGGALAMAALASLFTWGVTVGLRAGATPVLRDFSAACLLIIGLNLLIHSFYGGFPFVYSQHWLTPSIFFLVPALLGVTTGWSRSLQGSIAGALVLALLASNAVWVARTASEARAIVRDFRHPERPADAGPVPKAHPPGS